jgi:hypothetical protein
MSKVETMVGRLNQDANDQQRSLRKRAGEILWKMYGPQRTNKVAFSVWKQALDTAKAEASLRATEDLMMQLETARMAEEQAKHTLETDGSELQKQLAGKFDDMEAEREARMIELQDSAKSMDDLREQLERANEAEEAARRSGSEDAIKAAKDAKMAASRKMAERMWKMYGPQTTLLVAWQSWTRVCEVARLEAADQKYKEMKSTMGKSIGEKLYKMFGPMSLLLETFAGWVRALEMTSDDELRGELARAKAAQIEAQASGQQDAIIAA